MIQYLNDILTTTHVVTHRGIVPGGSILIIHFPMTAMSSAMDPKSLETFLLALARIQTLGSGERQLAFRGNALDHSVIKAGPQPGCPKLVIVNYLGVHFLKGVHTKFKHLP